MRQADDIGHLPGAPVGGADQLGLQGLGGTATGLNGAISVATWVPSGKYGTALSFNGSGRLVTIPDANVLDLATGMTLEAWVYPTAAATDARPPCSRNGPADSPTPCTRR